MKFNFSIILLLCFSTCSFQSFGQATLQVQNNSVRMMRLKEMEFDGGNGTLFKELCIGAYQNETIEFYASGKYLTKTKASLGGKEPVYEKGKPFEVVNDSRGQSVMTLMFSIRESSIPVTSGKKISKGEFEKN